MVKVLRHFMYENTFVKPSFLDINFSSYILGSWFFLFNSLKITLQYLIFSLLICIFFFANELFLLKFFQFSFVFEFFILIILSRCDCFLFLFIWPLISPTNLSIWSLATIFFLIFKNTSHFSLLLGFPQVLVFFFLFSISFSFSFIYILCLYSCLLSLR